MDDPSVLPRQNMGLLKDATRKEIPLFTDFENGQPILDRCTSLLRENWSDKAISPLRQRMIEDMTAISRRKPKKLLYPRRQDFR
jgi:hypothetical protein